MQSRKLDALIATHWPDTVIATTTDLARKGVGDRALTQAVRCGKLIRLRRGAYIQAQDWRQRKPWEKDLLRIQAHHSNASRRSVYSHASAARLHGCSPWDAGSSVHVVTSFSPAQASSGEDVIAHGGPLEPWEILELQASWPRPVRVTSLERTVIDCARTMDFEQAVVVADQALRRGADEQLLQDYVDSGRITRGVRRVRRVLEAMDARSESVGETRTRVLLGRLGIHDAVLQLDVDTPLGRYRGDFGWMDRRVILEFDGRTKYFDYAPTEEVIFNERRREKALMDSGWEVVRIGWEHLGRPWDVERKVKAALERRPYERRKPAVPLLGSNGTAGWQRVSAG
ncbi:type IV toxin-antitoxin system AbiEi family antitoxin domain-containing protein [Paenarthrobacter sp. NPDC056912]|uniref:type IV toxin-antitoxin system AbiEi family antitoxin domain-containing protein n=1 Tax=Paenarthrobacter sp. NPDC056912 TaxID=3345965 RepID=UPI00366D5363